MTVSSKTKWTIFDVVVVFIFLVVLMGVTTTFAPKLKQIFSGLQFFGMKSGLILFFFSALLQSAYIIVIIVVLARFRRISFKEAGFIGRDFGNSFYMGIGGGFVLFFTVVSLSALITVIAKTIPPPQEVATLLMEMKGPGPRTMAFILSSIMAPLSEELYFRGMVYPVFRDKLGRKGAILISGIIFSLAHRDLFRFIPIAVGGFGLAYLYDRTGSLWTPIIAHSTWNTIMLVLMISVDRILPT